MQDSVNGSETPVLAGVAAGCCTVRADVEGLRKFELVAVLAQVCEQRAVKAGLRGLERPRAAESQLSAAGGRVRGGPGGQVRLQPGADRF